MSENTLSANPSTATATASSSGINRIYGWLLGRKNLRSSSGSNNVLKLRQGWNQGSASDSTTAIPQAVIEDDTVLVEERDWRTHFASRLSGRGLEIGPLHRPMVKHWRMKIDYIDRLTVAELREHYPELNDLPLVEPTIIGDAQTLSNVDDVAYDFVIAAHVIEHMKNPILALNQWCRVVRPGGLIYLIAPDKRVTFDKLRVRTPLEHLILDYILPSDERDYEHYLDFAIRVHHKAGIEALDNADELIAKDYSIHYHVFIPVDILNVLQWFSANVRPITVLEGPVMSPGSDEFHYLIQVD